jgi:hypothetical protein
LRQILGADDRCQPARIEDACRGHTTGVRRRVTFACIAPADAVFCCMVLCSRSFWTNGQRGY